MTLPIIEKPILRTILPTGKEIKFRPFTVKEQKNLLYSAESGTERDVLEGIVNLVNICTFDTIDWMKEPIVNLEHAFLYIRAKSVGEVVEMNFQCKAKNEDGIVCNHKSSLEVDIRTATHSPFPNPLIEVTDNIKMSMERLTVEDAIARFDNDDPIDLIYNKTSLILQGDSIYTEFSKDEFNQFLDSFPPDASERLDSYFRDQPTLILRPETHCPKCGNRSHIELKGVLNFFG